MRVRKPPKARLDEWQFNIARERTKENFETHGTVYPTVLGFCSKSNEMFLLPFAFTSEAEKAKLVGTAKLVFAALEVDHYVVISEVWRIGTDGSAVMINSVNHQRVRGVYYYIRRPNNDKPYLGPEKHMPNTEIGGVLCGLLPPPGIVSPPSVKESVKLFFGIEPYAYPK